MICLASFWGLRFLVSGFSLQILSFPTPETRNLDSSPLFSESKLLVTYALNPVIKNKKIINRPLADSLKPLRTQRKIFFSGG